MTTDAVGGVWTYALELVTALRSHGVEVHLAVMGPPADAAQLRDGETSGAAAIYENGAALEWMPGPWRALETAGEWLLDLEARLEPDVVHLNSFVHGALAFSAPVISVGHSCVLSWWEAVRREAAPPTWDLYRDRVRAGLAAASEVVAPTRWMLCELQRLYGVSGGRVIYNGLEGMHPAGARAPVVVAAGRLWDEGKNVRSVLQAAPKLSWPVVIAGTDAAGVENARGLGRATRPDLLQRLSTAGLFVHPALYEPFGLGPLEAALCGCPLVLGDIASLRELWDGAAAFVDPGDPRSLVERCNELIADADARAELTRRALERASTYTGAGMADGYLSLYRELAPSSATTAGTLA